VFLFDEPLSTSMPAAGAMRAEIKALHRPENHHGVCHARSDRGDDDGRSHRGDARWHRRQIGHAAGVFDKPGNLFAPSFIGSPAMNVLPGTLRRGANGAYVEASACAWPVPST